MFTVILLSLLIMSASLVGVIGVWRFAGSIIERNLKFLVSLSAGVFLAVSYALIIETIHLSSTPLMGFIWIGTGVIGVFTLFQILPAFHHHHDEKEESHRHSRIDARRILFSDGIHNIGDGVLLTSTFLANPILGALTAGSIFIHELVQETSEFFVLRQAGFSIRKALTLNLLVSATILLGSLGAFYLLDTFAAIQAPLLGIAAGSFLVVVFYDLIPHSVRHSKTRTHYLSHIAWFCAGVLIILGINALVPGHVHEEAHEEESAHAHEEEHHDHDH